MVKQDFFNNKFKNVLVITVLAIWQLLVPITPLFASNQAHAAVNNAPIDLGASGTNQSNFCAESDYFKVESTSSLSEGEHSYTGISKDGNSVSFTLDTTLDGDNEVDTIEVVSSDPQYDSIVAKAGTVFDEFPGPIVNMDKAISNFLLCYGEDTSDLGSITIEKNAIKDSDQVFEFGTTGLSTDNTGFTLVDDDTVGLPSKVFNDLDAGTYTVEELDTDGWYLSDITCSGESNIVENGSKITISLNQGDNVSCEFENRENIVVDPTNINPIFECWERDPNNEGRFIAYFGYENKTGETQNVPYGEFNNVTPSSYESNFPTEFNYPAGDIAGRESRTNFYPDAAIEIANWDGSNIVWNLTDQGTATASTNGPECPEEEPQVDYCDPADRPAGQSIAEWLEANQQDGSDCFDYEVTQRCGYFDVNFTDNKTGLFYEFNYVLGDQTPDVADFEDGMSLPATFDEDENNGSVELTYYVVGAEKDYFVGFGMPNIWDGNGETVQVDTDCEEPEGSITIVKELDDNEESDQAFTFTADWEDESFQLDVNDDETLSDTKVFKGLEAGVYTVTEDLSEISDDWEIEEIFCTVNGEELEDGVEIEDGVSNEMPFAKITLAKEQNVTCTFVNEEEPDGGGGGNGFIVEGAKYLDANSNGVRDDGEVGLEGWTIELYAYVCDEVAVNSLRVAAAFSEELVVPVDCEYELQKTDVTDEDGDYLFTAFLGSYKVCEVQQEGWTQTAPSTDDGCHEFTASESAILGPYDFGNVEDVEEEPEEENGQVLGDQDTPEPEAPQVLPTTGIDTMLLESLFTPVVVGGLAYIYFRRRQLHGV